MRAYVDQDACVGCGVCIDICPEVFQWEDDKAVAYTNPIPKEMQDVCREAADSCPSEAISLEE